jgi:multicomponent Na+:H+ antiporter subunit D
VTLSVGRWRPGLTFPLAVLGIVVSTGASAAALASVLRDGEIRYYLGGWEPPLGIEYVVDHVSAFVVLVITSVALVVVVATRRIAAREMLQARLGTFYAMVLLLLTGLTGIVVTGDLFNLFVFLEIASLSAYTLAFLGGGRGMVAAFRYLVLGTVGGSLYLLGVGFLYFATGSLNMADIARILPGLEDSRAVLAAAVLIFTGLGLKMALFPLHLWLPDVYTYSLSSVNTLIAPIMTKVAAYAMLRMFLSVFSIEYLQDSVPIAGVLVVLGLAGVVLGSVAAMAQSDLRRMLAYSSISQISLIGVGIGLASPLAFVAALLHVMNHAVMKSCLFLTAATIRRRTGNSDIRQMGGLGRQMPVTMAAFALASLSMIGIPPTAGFFSKWYLAQAGIESGQWTVVAIVLLSSLLTAVYLFKVLERVYLSPAPAPQPPDVAAEDAASVKRRAKWREAPPGLLVPIVVLALAVVILGLLNTAIVTHVLERGVG